MANLSDLWKIGDHTPTSSDIPEGGLAIDTTNKKVFSQATDGSIFEVGGSAGGSSFDPTADQTITGDWTFDGISIGAGNINDVRSTGVGLFALRSVSTGKRNTCFGSNAGSYITTGEKNTFIGDNVAQGLRLGSRNIGIGSEAMQYTRGNDNVMIGNLTGGSTSGDRNVYIGTGTGNSAGSNSGNVLIGYEVGRYKSLSNKLMLGNNSTEALIDGDFAAKTLTINGIASADRLYSMTADAWIQGVTVGRGSGSSNASSVAVGADALATNTLGIDNVAIGYRTLNKNTDGNSNVALGREALTSNVSSSNNTAIGHKALTNTVSGDKNTALGHESLTNNSNGDGNVAIGYRAGYNENTSNKLHIANNETESLIEGDFSAKTVNVNGTLTVNGLPIGGGGGFDPSTDQNITGSWEFLKELTIAGITGEADISLTGELLPNNGARSITVDSYRNGLSSLNLTEWGGTTGILMQYDGDVNEAKLVSRNNGVDTTIYTIPRDAPVLDFKVAPTVNGAAIGGGGGFDPSTDETITGTWGFDKDILVNGKTLGSGLNSVPHNSAFGTNALGKSTSGLSNTAIGGWALEELTSAGKNTAIGAFTLNSTNSELNTAIGYRAGIAVTGYGNTAIGGESLGGGSGEYNVCVGLEAGYTAEGDNNIMIGHQSGYWNQTGNNNTILGHHGLHEKDVSGCVAIGYQAGYSEASNNKLHIANNKNQSLIEGDFSAKTVNINGTFTVNGLPVGGGGDFVDLTTDQTIAGIKTFAKLRTSETGLALGLNSAVGGQGTNAVALGASTGSSGLQGARSIALGYQAGTGGIGDDAIVLGAGGAEAKSILVNASGDTGQVALAGDISLVTAAGSIHYDASAKNLNITNPTGDANIVLNGSRIPTTTASNTAPANPTVGDIWIEI